ncbi:MAG TPA: D-glycerate dehydrogenase [Solirubrobacteraceae bacterium]|nr:D-glycerate dehydrogenase [Solirubrobacteraceae bacterium]
MARVFITRRLPGAALARLEAEHETEVWLERLPPPREELLARTAEVDGLISMITDRIDAELMDHAPRLRAISNYAVGTDNVDLAAATEREIPVGNTPDVLTDATADLAFALLLAAARKLPEAAEAVREGDWPTWEPMAHLGHSVHGATLGIVGFGRIGRAVAARARGFEMEVLHTSTSTSTSTTSGLPLDTVLERSDFVSLHCPLTPATRHLIDARALGRMRPTAILVNTARGPIVDQVALRAALADGTITGAALDVCDPEPAAPDDPLLSAPNLLLTPHIGSGTVAARERMTELAVENLLAGLEGRAMPHQANGVTAS